MVLAMKWAGFNFSLFLLVDISGFAIGDRSQFETQFRLGNALTLETGLRFGL